MKKRVLCFAAFLLTVMIAFSFAGISNTSSEDTAAPEQKTIENRAVPKESWPYGGDFGPCEISSKIKGVSKYSSSKLEVIGEEKAAAAGVPEGFSGSVITMAKGVDLGVAFDFSAAKIGVNALKSIAVKVYVEPTDGDVKTGDEHYPEIRIGYPGRNDVWSVQYDMSSKTGRWVTIVLYADGKNFTNENKIYAGKENALAAFADESGYLKAFEVGLRRKFGTGLFYIDSVTFNFKYDNGEPPVITYSGPEVMRIAKGSEFTVDAVAWDDGDKCAYPLEYAWEGAVDDDGMPAVGTKTVLKLRSYDGFGNGSEIRVKAEICPPDTTPPDIKLPCDTVYCREGTVPYPQVEVYDEFGVADTSYTWEKGALDLIGRLTEGERKVTITATDTSGNTSEKTVIYKVGDLAAAGFTVTEDENAE